jgi:hypothetical protein
MENENELLKDTPSLEQEKMDLNKNLALIEEVLKSRADKTQELLESLKAIPPKDQNPNFLTTIKTAEEINDAAFSIYSTFKKMIEDLNNKAPELNTHEDFQEYYNNVIKPILVAIQDQGGENDTSND